MGGSLRFQLGFRPLTRLRLAAGALLLGAALSAGTASADEQTDRRLTVTLLTLDMAQTACGYRIVQPRLAGLLSSANVTREQLYGRPITPALQQTINDLQNRFVRDAAAACGEVWRQFGPASEAALVAR